VITVDVNKSGRTTCTFFAVCVWKLWMQQYFTSF
jgi:hypothetical protein